MKYFSVCILISFCMFSCASDKVEIPDGVLPVEKMVLVMADVQITEAAMMYRNSNGDFTDNKAPAYYQFIFSKHKISEKVFRDSFKFYSDKPELMDKIYEEVIIEITKRQAVMPVK